MDVSCSHVTLLQRLVQLREFAQPKASRTLTALTALAALAALAGGGGLKRRLLEGGGGGGGRPHDPRAQRDDERLGCIWLQASAATAAGICC